MCLVASSRERDGAATCTRVCRRSGARSKGETKARVARCLAAHCKDKIATNGGGRIGEHAIGRRFDEARCRQGWHVHDFTSHCAEAIGNCPSPSAPAPHYRVVQLYELESGRRRAIESDQRHSAQGQGNHHRLHRRCVSLQPQLECVDTTLVQL